MAQIAPADIFAPRSPQVWQALIDWLTFFYQVIARVAPCIAQVLSCIGLRRPLLASSSPPFKPLPVVELPLHQSSELKENSCCVVADAGGAVGYSFRPLEKLTLLYDLELNLFVLWSVIPAIVLTQATEAGLKWFELECAYSDKECEAKPKISYVIVFEVERPDLREFLRQIREFANLVLFTAGVEGYAKPLVDRIDPENRFGLRLYRSSTVSTAHREHVKDLSCLSKDLRVGIVDDNPFSFLLQPLNGIPCVPFTAAQPCDDQLLEVILPLLKDLSLQEDVRPVLQDKFRMPEWFRIHGIPVSGWRVQSIKREGASGVRSILF